MGLCMLLSAGAIFQEIPALCLVLLCLFVLTFGATVGSVFFVYIAEICEDAALGFCISVLMLVLFLQTMFTELIISAVDVTGLFLILGVWQVLTCVILYVGMKETKGLTKEEKAVLYRSL